MNISDRFTSMREPRSSGVIVVVDNFEDNLLNVDVAVKLSKTFVVKGIYENKMLDYQVQDFKDLASNSYTAHMEEAVSPKVKLFIEYTHINTKYDQSSNVIPDSKQDKYFAGFKWDVTQKTSGSLKAGYSKRVVDGISSKREDIVLMGDLNYKFSPKSNIRECCLRRFFI